MEKVSTSRYLPPYHQENSLISDISGIMDELLLVFSIEYRDVWDKYKSFFSNYSAGFMEWSEGTLEEKLSDDEKDTYLKQTAIDVQALEAVIEEFGYKYVYDLLVNYRPTQEDVTPYMEQCKAFLNFIHVMKGHKIGLMFILSLLSIEAYTKEWWELVDEFSRYAMNEDPGLTWTEARELYAEVAEPDTFWLVITAHIPSDELIAALISFCRDYVYPIVEVIVEQIALYDKPCVVTGCFGEAIFEGGNWIKVVTNEVFVEAGCMGDGEVVILSYNIGD